MSNNPVPGAGEQFTGGPPNLTNLINTLNQINLAIGELNKTIKATSMQATSVTGSAGSSAGKYLNIIGTDGNPYAIALLNP